MTVLLVSPTEPLLTRQLGVISPLCEARGADYLIPTPAGLVGIQRKTIPDLIASLADGRLYEGLAKLRQLTNRVLVIEGHPTWSDTGELIFHKLSPRRVAHHGISRAQWWGLLLSAQLDGTWVLETGSLDETATLLTYLPRYFSKTTHSSLAHRPGPTTAWGTADSRDWGIHLLQSFEGIGHDTAANIYDHFDGVPMAWTVTEKELTAVKGVAKGRARKLTQALETRKDEAS